MNFYEVTYEGSYLGGIAIVAADSEEEAIELVRTHKETSGFQKVAVEYIPVPGPCVLYNDNGDY